MGEFSYSIKDVHERTNLSRTTISNLYNGYSDGIKFDTLEKLCELFSCTPNDLIKVNDLKFNDISYKKEILLTMYKKIIRLIQMIKWYFITLYSH